MCALQEHMTLCYHCQRQTSRLSSPALCCEVVLREHGSRHVVGLGWCRFCALCVVGRSCHEARVKPRGICLLPPMPLTWVSRSPSKSSPRRRCSTATICTRLGGLPAAGANASCVLAFVCCRTVKQAGGGLRQAASKEGWYALPYASSLTYWAA